MNDLCDYEKLIMFRLKHGGLEWGAAVGSALEFLRSQGLVETCAAGVLGLSLKGRELLTDLMKGQRGRVIELRRELGVNELTMIKMKPPYFSTDVMGEAMCMRFVELGLCDKVGSGYQRTFLGEFLALYAKVSTVASTLDGVDVEYELVGTDELWDTDLPPARTRDREDG